jgi:hypothetical protein
MQSGGEEEQDEETHTPLPPPMKIINDPTTQDDKVGGSEGEREGWLSVEVVTRASS